MESLLAQSFSNWEAIIIDDGSTDETYQVAAKFVDPRIRYVYQENQGLSAARNTGLNLATTEIIALLDADDVWKENYLEMMVPVLLDQQDVVAVYCGFYFIDESGEENNIEDKVLDSIEQQVKAAVEDSIQFAMQAPDPDPSETYQHVFAETTA